MISATKAIYSSIVALILSGGGLGYYLLSGNSATPDAQSTNGVNPEDPITLTNNGENTIQQTVTETTPATQQYDAKDINIRFKDGDNWIKKPITDKYPTWVREPHLIESAERTKKEDPVLYRYHYDNPFHKTIDPKDAKEKVSVLMDYTMLIMDCSGGRGTAWILDYILPEGGQKYPTKFFIATDGHVVNGIKWDESNPYEQLLSTPEKDSKGYSRCFSNGSGQKATLVKEKVKAHEDDDFDRNKWALSKLKHQYPMWYADSRYNVSQYQGESHKNVDSDYWQFKLHITPKLVYFPHNYLGTSKHPEHAADFAILEVDFVDENVAKLFTRDFYGKYDREKGTHKHKALDFFARPLYETHTSQKLLEEDVQLWMAGYPGIGHHHKASTNYNINKKSASRVAYRGVKDADGRLLLGHMKALGRYWNWNGKPVTEVGYLYSFSDPQVEHGASGSVITTENNAVLGVYSYISSYGDIGGATPIRGAEIKDKDGKVVFHAYDFIEGVEGQNGSYKEQVQKYILKDGKQTSLSKLRGWKPAN